MTIRDRVKKAYTYHGLNTRGFAETGIYTPFGGSARSLKTSVTVRVVEEETDGTRDRRETIEVFVVKDDGTVGVTGFSHGDSYVRDVLFESNSAPYRFVGEVLEQGRDYIRAVFERYLRTAQGRGA